MLTSDKNDPPEEPASDYSKQLDEEIDQLIADLREYMGKPGASQSDLPQPRRERE